MKVVWSPLAETRAVEAAEYIAADDPAAASAWLEHLVLRVEHLSRFPKRGRVVPEIGHPEYRQMKHPPYRVIYRVDARQVVILTIRHNRRTWDADEMP